MWVPDVVVIGAGAAGLSELRCQTVGGEGGPAELARPLRGTLFFAGEAADLEGRTGTVHGAIATGRRAAREAMKSLTARSSAGTRAGSD